MRLVRRKDFGPVTAWELGYGPVGRPFMTVHVYLAGTALIDTGQSHMHRAVAGFTALLPLDMVLLTHHHEDHSGNASLFNRRGIPVYAHHSGLGKLRRTLPIMPYQRLVWGAAPPCTATPLPATIDAETTIIPIHTPGHSHDHVAYHAPAEGWLFSGDVYLAESLAYLRADEEVHPMISSLKKLLALDFDALFCAHRPCGTRGKEHLAARLHFLEDICGQICSLATKGYNERAIMRALGLREDRLVHTLSRGNMSMRNLVRSALRDPAAETYHANSH